MIGVNYDLFWTLNPKSLSPFTKAFSLRQKYDDMMAWHSGIYIQLAIASAFSKNTKYPEKPFMQQTRVGLSEEDKKAIFKAKMMERMKIINSRFEKR